MNRRRLRPFAVFALIALIFAIRCGHAAVRDSITWDETTHLTHTLHYWSTGDDLAMWDLGTPRLCHLIDALPSSLALRFAGRLPAGAIGVGDIRSLVLSGEPLVLLPARLAAIGWGVALLALIAWGVGRRRGATEGLIACAIVGMVPEILAHSAIAGSDIPFAATAILAVIALARYAERPTLGRWVAVAGAIGLAWAMRHTALLFLGLAGVTHLVVGIQQASDRRLVGLIGVGFRSVAAGLGMTALAFAVLWAGDGFGTVTIAEVAEQAEHVRLPETAARNTLDQLPVPTSLVGLVRQIRHQGMGHEAYFLGERGEHGWSLYFPVAFALKTPVGLLVLLILASARFRPRDAWEWLCLGTMGLLWASLIRSHVDIGVRYALLTYPLAAPFLARLFEPRERRDRVWWPTTVVLTVAFAAASLAAHPRYLSSFNEIGGGPSRGWLYLADSNLDWGQDLDEIGAVCQGLGIEEVTIDIATQRRLDLPGLAVHGLPNRSEQVFDDPTTPESRRLYDKSGHYISCPTRYLAVGASRLMGLYSQNDLDWVRSRRLVDRIGHAAFLFDLEDRATTPLAP